jgi:hypothetical protein
MKRLALIPHLFDRTDYPVPVTRRTTPVAPLRRDGGVGVTLAPFGVSWTCSSVSQSLSLCRVRDVWRSRAAKPTLSDQLNVGERSFWRVYGITQVWAAFS